MKISLKQIAELIGGKIIGDENLFFTNVARIDEAKKGELTFLYLPAYEKYFARTKASAIIVKPEFNRTRNDITYVISPKPHEAFQKIILNFFLPEVKFRGIDSSAQVSDKAKLGENITLGKNVVVSEGCNIGNGSIILHNSVLMENVEIGENCLIYPNVTIRENCKIGNNVIIHSGTVIGSDGFGFERREDGSYSKIPQIGNVVIGNDCEIGSNVSIDRAAIGSTVIGNGVKLDNLIQIAHNVKIGDNTVISAQSGISGSTKIGNNCILAGQVGVAGHLEITDNVIIGAQSGISKSLGKPGKYFGYPAKDWATSLRLEAHIRNLPNYSAKLKELENKLKDLENKINKEN